jgi:hypothetical protein
MKDWLGNELVVGDQVLYTSKSTHVGMNKGELLLATAAKIQIRIPVMLWDAKERGYRPGGTKIVTLHSYNGAYDSVTKYFGPPTEDQNVGTA